MVGLDGGRYGYPRDFPNDPLIDMLLPFQRSPLEEERRLFYVGLTRAKREVTILSVGARPSLFALELTDYPETGVVNYLRLPGVVRHLCPACKSSWLQRQRRGGRVECGRRPYCGFVASEGQFPDLPPLETPPWERGKVR